MADNSTQTPTLNVGDPIPADAVLGNIPTPPKPVATPPPTPLRVGATIPSDAIIGDIQKPSPTTPGVQPAPTENGIPGFTAIGQTAKGIGEGGVLGMGETIHGIGTLGNYLGMPLLGALAHRAVSDEDLATLKTAFKPGNEAEKTGQQVGNLGESILEFVLGDEALKGISFADKMGLASKVAKLAETSPRLARFLKLGAEAGRVGTVVGAQTGLKTEGTPEERGQAAIESGLTNAALVGGLATVGHLAAPIVRALTPSAYNAFAKAIDLAVPEKRLNFTEDQLKHTFYQGMTDAVQIAREEAAASGSPIGELNAPRVSNLLDKASQKLQDLIKADPENAALNERLESVDNLKTILDRNMDRIQSTPDKSWKDAAMRVADAHNSLGAVIRLAGALKKSPNQNLVKAGERFMQTLAEAEEGEVGRFAAVGKSAEEKAPIKETLETKAPTEAAAQPTPVVKAEETAPQAAPEPKIAAPVEEKPPVAVQPVPKTEEEAAPPVAAKAEEHPLTDEELHAREAEATNKLHEDIAAGKFPEVLAQKEAREAFEKRGVIAPREEASNEVRRNALETESQKQFGEKYWDLNEDQQRQVVDTVDKAQAAKPGEVTRGDMKDYVNAYLEQYEKGEPGISQGLTRKDGSGELVFRDKQGKPIGVAAYSPTAVTDLAVAEGARRQGVATALTDELEKRGIKNIQGPFTEEGKAFAASRAGGDNVDVYKGRDLTGLDSREQGYVKKYLDEHDVHPDATVKQILATQHKGYYDFAGGRFKTEAEAAKYAKDEGWEGFKPAMVINDKGKGQWYLRAPKQTVLDAYKERFPNDTETDPEKMVEKLQQASRIDPRYIQPGTNSFFDRQRALVHEWFHGLVANYLGLPVDSIGKGSAGAALYLDFDKIGLKPGERITDCRKVLTSLGGGQASAEAVYRTTLAGGGVGEEAMGRDMTDSPNWNSNITGSDRWKHDRVLEAAGIPKAQWDGLWQKSVDRARNISNQYPGAVNKILDHINGDGLGRMNFNKAEFHNVMENITGVRSPNAPVGDARFNLDQLRNAGGAAGAEALENARMAQQPEEATINNTGLPSMTSRKPNEVPTIQHAREADVAFHTAPVNLFQAGDRFVDKNGVSRVVKFVDYSEGLPVMSAVDGKGNIRTYTDNVVMRNSNTPESDTPNVMNYLQYHDRAGKVVSRSIPPDNASAYAPPGEVSYYTPDELLQTHNAKTVLGEKQGVKTGIVYLKPDDANCPFRTPGCGKNCLYTAGRGGMSPVQAARVNKTQYLLHDPEGFFHQMVGDVKLLTKKAAKENMVPAVRFNGTSDLPDLARRLASEFDGRDADHPFVQFYDYTKVPKPWERTTPNYHLTFSRSEYNWGDSKDALDHGINVAVVFQGDEGDIPTTYNGYKVIDGTKSDARFLDPKSEDGKGQIVGLCAKGKARHDTGSGFVVSPDHVENPNLRFPGIKEFKRQQNLVQIGGKPEEKKPAWSAVKEAARGLGTSD